MFDWLRNKRKIGKQAPAFWQTYLATCQKGLDRRRLVEEVNFVVFDTETTGLDIKNDRILSIGAVRVKNWQIELSDSLDYFVHQEYQPKNKQSIAVHGILPVMRMESMEEEQAVQLFLGYIGNSVLVGHHVLFDVSMINKSLARMKLGKLKNEHLDTAHLDNRILGIQDQRPARSLGLDELCVKYSIPPADRHTAAGDAYITAILLMKLLDELKKRGVRNLADLLR